MGTLICEHIKSKKELADVIDLSNPRWEIFVIGALGPLIPIFLLVIWVLKGSQTNINQDLNPNQEVKG